MDQGLSVVLAATIPSALTLLTALVNGREIKQVKYEVKTMNGSTMGQLASATETRRVEEIAPIDRTPLEKEHMEAQ